MGLGRVSREEAFEANAPSCPFYERVEKYSTKELLRLRDEWLSKVHNKAVIWRDGTIKMYEIDFLSRYHQKKWEEAIEKKGGRWILGFSQWVNERL